MPRGASRLSTTMFRSGELWPGVPVIPLPVAPRQIPYHAAYAYFELDQSHELWEQMKASGGVAIYVSGEFPGLAMEFWAIRG